MMTQISLATETRTEKTPNDSAFFFISLVAQRILTGMFEMMKRGCGATDRYTYSKLQIEYSNKFPARAGYNGY